jgi:hypothetical protein
MTAFRVLAPSSGTGEIRAYRNDEIEAPGAPDGYAWFALLDEARPSTHYMLDGEAIAYTEDQRNARQIRPFRGAVWLIPECEWAGAPDLADLRAIKNEHINAWRLAANQSSFTFAGKQIAVDPLSRSDIDATHGIVLMLGAMPPGWPGAWKAVDNTYVSIPDVATWGSFYGAMVAQGMANFAHSQALKAYMTDPERTVAEVDAITWETEIPT